MRSKEFPEGKLIRSAQMRPMGKSVIGGTAIDVKTFSQMLFGDDIKKISDYVVSYDHEASKTKSIPEREHKGTYVLSHAFINGHGHAIAGYMSRGSYKIFDSNFTRPISLDWQKHPMLLKKHFDTYYPKNNGGGEIHIKASYINTKKILPNNPPELRFNFTKLNNKKNLSRYPAESYLKFFRNLYTESNFKNSNKNNMKKFLTQSNNPNTIKLQRYIIYKNSVPLSNGGVNRRVLMRRLYRLKFKKEAPSNLSDKQLFKSVVNLPDIYNSFYGF
jgi:hypothetical protein